MASAVNNSDYKPLEVSIFVRGSQHSTLINKTFGGANMTDRVPTIVKPDQVEGHEDVTIDRVCQSPSRRSFLTTTGIGATAAAAAAMGPSLLVTGSARAGAAGEYPDDE